MIPIATERKMMRSTIERTEQKNESLLVDEAHLAKLTELIRSKVDDQNSGIKMIYVKAMLGLFAPERPKDVNLEQERAFYRKIFAEIDWKKVGSRRL